MLEGALVLCVLLHFFWLRTAQTIGAHWMPRWSVFTAVCCVHTRAVLQDCASAVLQTPDAAEARVLASILNIFHVCCVSVRVCAERIEPDVDG